MAVDPGGVSRTTHADGSAGDGATGVVIFEPVEQMKIKVLDAREIRDRFEFLDWARQQQRLGGVEYCVCEYYAPRAGVRTWEPDVVYIIGTLEWMFRPENFYGRQKVGDSKNWGTQTKLMPYLRPENPDDVKVPAGGGHAISALKHALLWTATRWDGRQ